MDNLQLEVKGITLKVSSSPITPKGMIVTPCRTAILTNSDCSGQNSLYASSFKTEVAMHTER